MKISEAGNPGAGGRAPLTRERMVSAAIELADREGSESLSGRCDDDAEFEFVLDFILDGLARLQ